MDEKDEIHYRLIFREIEQLLQQKDSAIIAIDGMCGSGKSYLASLLTKRFDCNTIHMDDFFVPFEMKTKERLAEPGGNVHYERFQTEVLDSLKKSERVEYRPYLCPQWVFGDPIVLEPKKLTIIEGSYSHHPIFQHTYDLKIFMKLEAMEQEKRIFKRNGEEMLEKFISLWIPLENYYFESYNIESQANISIDTTKYYYEL